MIEVSRRIPVNEPAPLMLAADEVEHYQRGKPGRKPRRARSSKAPSVQACPKRVKSLSWWPAANRRPRPGNMFEPSP